MLTTSIINFLELVAQKKAFFGCENWPLILVASYSGAVFFSFFK